jgi:hypothetical protein
MRPNAGWWWTVFGFSGTDPALVLRSRQIHCFIRHLAAPRIEESCLRYPDEGNLPVVDLGAGGEARELGTRRTGDPWEIIRRRHVRGHSEQR